VYDVVAVVNQTAFFFSRMGKLKSTHRSVIVVIVDSRPCLKTKHQSYWNYFLVSDDSSLLSMRADTDVRLILVLRVYSACRKPQVQCLQGRDRRHRCVRRWQEVTFRSFSRFYSLCVDFPLAQKGKYFCLFVNMDTHTDVHICPKPENIWVFSEGKRRKWLQAQVFLDSTRCR